MIFAGAFVTLCTLCVASAYVFMAGSSGTVEGRYLPPIFLCEPDTVVLNSSLHIRIDIDRFRDVLPNVRLIDSDTPRTDQALPDLLNSIVAARVLLQNLESAGRRVPTFRVLADERTRLRYNGHTRLARFYKTSDAFEEGIEKIQEFSRYKYSGFVPDEESWFGEAARTDAHISVYELTKENQVNCIDTYSHLQIATTPTDNNACRKFRLYILSDISSAADIVVSANSRGISIYNMARIFEAGDEDGDESVFFGKLSQLPHKNGCRIIEGETCFGPDDPAHPGGL